MTWVLCGFIAAILVMWAWREHIHDRERRDLLNRVMAKDLYDYRAVEAKNKPPPGRIRNSVLAGMRHSKNQMNGAAGGD